jgi:hypothetical protein
VEGQGYLSRGEFAHGFVDTPNAMRQLFEAETSFVERELTVLSGSGFAKNAGCFLVCDQEIEDVRSHSSVSFYVGVGVVNEPSVGASVGSH